MYLISFRANLTEVRQLWPSLKSISVHIQRTQSWSQTKYCNHNPKTSFGFSAWSNARCQSKWEIIPKQRDASSFYKWEEIEEERKLLPPKFIESMAIFTALTDGIQCPLCLDSRSPFSRWLSRSRGALRLFFAMAHEFQSFNGNLLLLYCFLMGGKTRYRSI